MNTRTLVATAAAAMAIGTVASAPAALAADGSANNGWAHTFYTDNAPDDEYTVCDDAKDGMSAVGWLEVRNADGSWYQYAHLRAAGKGNCTSNDVNIINTKEDRQIKVVVCRRNFSNPDSHLRNCDRRTFRGD